jgi:hypothetical protein
VVHDVFLKIIYAPLIEVIMNQKGLMIELASAAPDRRELIF